MKLFKLSVVMALASALPIAAMQLQPVQQIFNVIPEQSGQLWVEINYVRGNRLLFRDLITGFKNDKGTNEFMGVRTQSSQISNAHQPKDSSLKPEQAKENYVSCLHFLANQGSDFALNLGLRLAAQINDEQTDKKIAQDNIQKAKEELTEPNNQLNPFDQACAELQYEYLLENSIKHELSCEPIMKL